MGLPINSFQCCRHCSSSSLLSHYLSSHHQSILKALGEDGCPSVLQLQLWESLQDRGVR